MVLPVIPDLPDKMSEFWDDVESMTSIWKALAPWFKDRGYILYPRESLCAVPSSGLSAYQLSGNPVKFPYAYASETRLASRVMRMARPCIFPAVDKNRRDVIVKFLFNDAENTHEVSILKHLISESLRSDPLNKVIPVFDVLTYDDRYSFVVMPRWGSAYSLHYCGFDCLGTAFNFASCLLKALAFLHKNLIAHRDIRLDNVLVNVYGKDQLMFDYRPFLSSRQADFVLCDFGVSIMFPPDTPQAERMRPVSESELGSYQYHPPDAANGQAMYDPFAYDVACLGGLFCEHMTTLVPSLAPFLDRMITSDIASRYTASEALEAFTQLYEDLAPHYLGTPAPPPPLYGTVLWQGQDRWAGLPEDFVSEHTSHYAPAKPKYKAINLDGTSCFLDIDTPN
ncbi:unnamed protein product [Somion occarium]|uniref:Protein kinase domain-containing protein n=1 Tax=Somion occarium TaxID=3059160 RepID=A0ABP1CRS0_9APHY